MLTPRTRTKNFSAGTTDVSRSKRTWIPTTNQWSDYSIYDSHNVHPYTGYETMNDVVVKNFHKLSKAGRIFNNPLSATKVSENQSVVSYNRSYRLSIINPPKLSAGSDIEGLVPMGALLVEAGKPLYIDSPIADPDWIQSIQNQAVTQAYANIDMSEILTWASLAESGKTVHSLAGILKRVIRVFKTIRKGKFKKLKKQVKDVRLYADAWMEARYSLRPLYYDIMGCISAAKKPSTASIDRFTFRGRKSGAKVSEDFAEIIHTSAGGVLTIPVYWSSTLSVEARAGCLCQCKPTSKAQIWGFDRIVDSAWELIPFSFIVDWFMNVGDVLKAWTPVYGTKVLASWVTTNSVATQSVSFGDSSFTLTPPNWKNRYDGSQGYCSPGYQSKTTIIKERIPNPYRQVLPNFSVNLSAAKILDIGIIVSSLKKEAGKLKRLENQSTLRH